MTRATSTIPFSTIKFIDNIPRLSDLTERLTQKLREIRMELNQREPDRMTAGRAQSRYDLITDVDTIRIKRRAMRYLERLHNSTGTQHLPQRDEALLTPLRGGLPVARIVTEHEADEIAAALHAEMPWMAPATEVVWHGLRASARRGLLGLRFDPLVLVGSPGIGKSYWARRLAHHLEVPTTSIDATGESAAFSLGGAQRGWGSASPGKLMQTALRERHAGPIVIIDEVEKSGDVQSNQGSRHTLTDALLPLLERMTAETWECPYYQIRCGMSWVNWVMTANSRWGLPAPLISRCIVLDLPDLTGSQLRIFVEAQGTGRGLPRVAIDATSDAIQRAIAAGRTPSLRTVSRMLDHVELQTHRQLLQ
ncbi:AAA family ATPase [Puniceibacterium sediminis]|uniref:ATPase family associated with various cellular activities (AAA) n=1 Tax=Puniceibacterium sediminis TaxID=1608407 RepID=A0A238WPS5_9RHOB|nr:AAA family ATPase [Puniceibacterium sediminis]SNR48408.1 ATPase family associated with various cellular activities (AAA) [Puniceibacterium sediminis]